MGSNGGGTPANNGLQNSMYSTALNNTRGFGQGGNNFGFNNNAYGAQNAYQGQRDMFQNNMFGGLQGAQNNSQNAFNTAFGGYSSLLNQAANGGLGGGGGGVDFSNAIATLQGIQGPGNPWAGSLGTDIRTRNDSLLPGFYDRIRAEQGRLQNIQGGYNPGYTSQMAKLSRDQAHQAQSAKLNTDVELGERSAAAQAAQAAFAAQQAQGIAQLQAQQSMANASGGRASAAMNLQARLAALSGISGLRGQTPGEVNMYLNSMLGNLNAGQNFSNQAYGPIGQGSGGKSGGQRASQGASVAVPIAIALI